MKKGQKSSETASSQTAGYTYYYPYPQPTVCPTCGHCPTCGRQTVQPYQPYKITYTGSGLGNPVAVTTYM